MIYCLVSGPVMACILDKSMPRYCLLGETVMTCAELEKTSIGKSTLKYIQFVC